MRPVTVPHRPAAPTPAPDTPVVTARGVGIDTARYGHHATFLRPDLQPAAAPLDFTENAAGYARFRQRLQALTQRHGHVHFHIRLDAAGVYADNLLAFLHDLPEPKTISCGDPLRNKNYREAVSGPKKSDPVESHAMARFALAEKPKATALLPDALRVLRAVAGRLEAYVRQSTRLVNQLHQLLARAFPELATLVKEVSTGWVLELLDRYPTAAKIASARVASLEAIPYLPHEQVAALQQQARVSVASLSGPLVEQLVREQVRQVRDACARQKRLENWLVEAYQALPVDNHLSTIKGIGAVTAAILTAQLLDIDRFATDSKRVGYFGLFPVEWSSGCERDGERRKPRRQTRSARGNDLVRRYLWMAALSAAQHNPAVRPLYLRVRTHHPDQPSIAIGHCMRKLLRLVFAIWKSGKPFDPSHYPWEQPAHLTPRPSDSPVSTPEVAAPAEPAAGRKAVEPPRPAVTATGSDGARTDAVWVDFAQVRSQLSLTQVLAHLGALAGLKGAGDQRRGPCPLPGCTGKRTFSVQLTDNVWQCFAKGCGHKGDIIDLWSAMHGLPLRDAALALVQTFGLEAAPAPGTEKRNGLGNG